jgi:hypothetical protein
VSFMIERQLVRCSEAFWEQVTSSGSESPFLMLLDLGTRSPLWYRPSKLLLSRSESRHANLHPTRCSDFKAASFWQSPFTSVIETTVEAPFRQINRPLVDSHSPRELPQSHDKTCRATSYVSEETFICVCNTTIENGGTKLASDYPLRLTCRRRFPFMAGGSDPMPMPVPVPVGHY